MTFSLCQLCGTIIRFIFYKCDLLPNLTHLELQTAEFGQNLAKRAKFFVFGLMVFSFYHLLGHHIRFHLVRITFSSDSYCDLQHISKVLLFRTLTLYSRVILTFKIPVGMWPLGKTYCLEFKLTNIFLIRGIEIMLQPK